MISTRFSSITNFVCHILHLISFMSCNVFCQIFFPVSRAINRIFSIIKTDFNHLFSQIIYYVHLSIFHISHCLESWIFHYFIRFCNHVFFHYFILSVVIDFFPDISYSLAIYFKPFHTVFHKLFSIFHTIIYHLFCVTYYLPSSHTYNATKGLSIFLLTTLSFS